MGVPGRIGDIQPFAELDRGAATIVYKAYQQSLNRVVLLKLLRPSYTHVGEIVERFEEEARLIAQIQHPNVVTIYDYGREDDRSYFVAEFVEGMDLAALVEDGTVPIELATYIIREAAQGLAAAHRENILHRDIKPRNILIGADGHVKLTDFGMASIIPEEEAPGEIRGTPEYMAPEQLSRSVTSPASDLFSLGATFYELLAGRKAFSGGHINESIDAVLNHDPLPALEFIRPVPQELREMLGRLLAKDPSDRYGDCGAFVEDMTEFRAVRGLSAGASQLAEYLRDPAEYQPLTPDEELTMPVPVGAAPVAEREPDSALTENIRRLTAPFERLSGISRLLLAVIAVILVGYGGFIVSGSDDGNRAGPAEAFQGPFIVLPDSFDHQDPLMRYNTYHAFPVPGSSEAESADAAARTAEASTPPDDLMPDPRNEEPETGFLTVRARPDAAVFLDGDSLGFAPLADSIEVEAGTYPLLVRHPEFPEYRDSVVVASDSSVVVDVSLEELVGRLDIFVSPWAEVYINGALRDTIPYRDSPFFLPPGRHELSLQHPEFGVRDTVVWVVAGERHRLEFKLDEDRE